MSTNGAIAQLGERLNGIQEVVGSTNLLFIPILLDKFPNTLSNNGSLIYQKTAKK